MDRLRFNPPISVRYMLVQLCEYIKIKFSKKEPKLFIQFAQTVNPCPFQSLSVTLEMVNGHFCLIYNRTLKCLFLKMFLRVKNTDTCISADHRRAAKKYVFDTCHRS